MMAATLVRIVLRLRCGRAAKVRDVGHDGFARTRQGGAAGILAPSLERFVLALVAEKGPAPS